jgi:hypothetical protein
VSKFEAEVVEIPLGKIIKEVYIKDEGVIVIDPKFVSLIRRGI